MGLNPGQPFRKPDPASDFLRSEVTVEALRRAGNDLEEPARRLTPIIKSTLDELARCAGAQLVRMSGSGATCFALFDTAPEAVAAREDLAQRHPDWWVVATQIH